MIWLLLCLVALCAAAIVARPWWRRELGDEHVDRRRSNIAIYRQRLSELELEREAGTLAEAEFASAQAELGRRLLEDAERPEAVREAAPSTARWPAWIVVAAVPVLGLSLYALGGQWRLLGEVEALSRQDPEALVEELARRLRAQPDAEGYALLGRSYASLGRDADAVNAYAEANRLSDDQVAAWISDEAESRALLAGNDWRGDPQQRLQQALALAPQQPKALFYLGIAALQDGDEASAAAYWKRLMAVPNLPDEVRLALQQRLSELDQVAAATPEVGAGTLAIQIQVDIAPELRARAEDKWLFVFAKAAQGPPMPLAVQRLAVEAWPVSVTLDDSMAMTPALKLSQFDRWILTARVSMDGDAVPGAGDLQAEKMIEASNLGNRVDLVLGQVLQ